MTVHQQNQIAVINKIEEQVKNNSLNFSTVAPSADYDDDLRLCLTSVHLPAPELIKQIQNDITNPLSKIEPNYYYYQADSLHMTIKNIRVISDPPNFAQQDIITAKKVFESTVPKHHKFNVYFYRLLLFPNNLAFIGTTDPELDAIFIDLDKNLKQQGINDDKKYANQKYFFCNMTLVRYNQPSDIFKQKVKQISDQLSFDPYLIDSVTLLTSNAVLKNKNIIGNWLLQ